MDIRIDNFEVFVDGRRIDNPAHRIAIAVPAIFLAILLAGITVLILVPVLGLGLLILTGVVLLVIFWLVAWFLSPVILPVLVALGLFKWLSRD